MLPDPPGEVVVLIVDDEVIVRNVLQRALQLEGFSVLVAGDAFEALKVSRACTKLDLVVTDIEMPGMDGLALSVQLRQERPGVHVVFISGKLPASATAPAPLLAKPFRAKSLIDLIRRILGGPVRARALGSSDGSTVAD